MKLHLGIILVLLLSGCISVKLADSKVKRAKNLNFENPKDPFDSTGIEGADKSWINKENGNTISYQSTCEEASEPTLESMLESATKDIRNKEYRLKRNFIFNQRKAIRTLVFGKVDGVSIKLDVVVFKKNNCNFILTYVALDEHFNTNKRIYDRFVRKFKAK